MKKNKILFIGTGAWGSALSSLLATNSDNSVRMWGISEKEIAEINKGKNHNYFGKLSLSKKIFATKNLDEVILDNDFIFLAVPSSHLKDVTKKIVKKIKNTPVFINLAKGLDKDENDIWSNSIKKIIKPINSSLVTLSGPSFAIDVVKKKPTIVDVVSSSLEDAKNVARLFSHSLYFKAIPLIDEIGVEMCGAIKNLLAIGTGIAQANHSSINTISAILTQGIFEIKEIIVLRGGKENTILGLSGIGDIFLTCTSKQSRNFSFGNQLYRKGFKILEEAKNKTIEGYAVYPIVEKIIKEHNLILPVIESICNVLNQNLSPKDFVRFVISKMGLIERN